MHLTVADPTYWQRHERGQGVMLHSSAQLYRVPFPIWKRYTSSLAEAEEEKNNGVVGVVWERVLENVNN